ncbi:MAG TPA: Flp family type IVb pilin [Tepidisphaeraceae bacterium]|nr:Flp family type IVb pilin [Tepidisphaeraceae bacterium]
MKSLWNDEAGATIVEYALMVALIAMIAIAGATLLGSAVADKLGNEAADAIAAAGS